MSDFIRLNIISEGQTEEYFVKRVLAPYLANFNIFTYVRSVLTGKDKKKSYRGGLINYQKAKNDILMWIKEDDHPEVRFTTMFDLYALPTDFPKYSEAIKINNPYEKVEFLEKAFKDDINHYRFSPYFQLHEFEALIFANPEPLKYEYFDYEKEIGELIKIGNEYKNPELINDDPQRAPSKRILQLIPEYDKANVGPDIAANIGIETLKQKCRHFNNWVTALERMSG